MSAGSGPTVAGGGCDAVFMHEVDAQSISMRRAEGAVIDLFKVEGGRRR